MSAWFTVRLAGHEEADGRRGTHEATEDVDARERGREAGEAGEEARVEGIRPRLGQG